jgi:hypothetical protein
MTYVELVRRAVEQGLLPVRPAPGCMTMMLVDDDGCIVSCPLSHELIRDVPALAAAHIALDDMLDERSRLRP